MSERETPKFKHNLKFSPALHEDNYLSLEKWRVILHRMNLIGENKKDGSEFGNLSKRILVGEDQFIINGFQTGPLANLDGYHYTRVIKCDLNKMIIEASGPIAPSNQAFLHFILYNSCPQINFIFHITSAALWSYLLKESETTFDLDNSPPSSSTLEVAKNCISQKPSGILALSQHQDRVIAFGPTTDITGKLILETLKKAKA